MSYIKSKFIEEVRTNKGVSRVYLRVKNHKDTFIYVERKGNDGVKSWVEMPTASDKNFIKGNKGFTRKEIDGIKQWISNNFEPFRQIAEENNLIYKQYTKKYNNYLFTAEGYTMFILDDTDINGNNLLRIIDNVGKKTYFYTIKSDVYPLNYKLVWEDIENNPVLSDEAYKLVSVLINTYPEFVDRSINHYYKF